jgi:LPS export ABC transporter protein LptC
MNRYLFLCFLIFISFCTACSLDYSEATIADESESEIPDTVLFDVTYTSVRNFHLLLQVEAESSKSYSNKNQAVLEKVQLTEYDSQGNTTSTGRADQIIFNTENENADFTGDIYFHSKREEASIIAENFYWDSEKRRLTADPEDKVVVQQDSGSQITGTQFSADMKTNIITYESPVQGTFVTEDDNENSE